LLFSIPRMSKFVIIFYVLLPIGVFAQLDEMQSQIDINLKMANKVKSITTCPISGNSTLAQTSRLNYDTLGRIIGEFTYGIHYSTKIKYNSQENIIEKIDSTSRGIKSHCKFSYTYDSNGHITKMISYYLEDTCIECRYNDSLFLNSTICQDTCIFRVNTYQYDNKYNTINEVLHIYTFKEYEKNETSYFYDKIDRLTYKEDRYYKWSYKYNKKGNLREIQKHLPSGEFSERTKLFYDYKNNLIKKLVFNSYQLEFMEKYKYDKNNNRIQMINFYWNRSERFANKYVYEYH